MPYIKKERRYDIIPPDTFHLDGDTVIVVDEIKDAGELNFAITVMILDYFYNNGGRYQQINDIVGALEGAKLEFNRRITATYEDKKIEENGDVYPKG